MNAPPGSRAAAAPAASGVGIGRVILGVLLVLVGVGWLIDTLGLADVRWSMILPAVLIVIGVAVLATARRSPSGGLVATGVIVSLLLLASSLLTIPFHGRLAGVGDVRHQPTTVEAVEEGFALGIGSLEVDLRQLPPPMRAVTVEAGVGIGELVIRAPDGVAVEVQARAGMGEVVVEERARGGVGVEVRDRLDGDDGALTLDVSVGIGKVEVRR